MNINKQVGVMNNTKENIELNNIVKQIIMDDDANTLFSMIKNGFDINDFQYKEFTGFNAIVACRCDYNYKEVGNAINMLMNEYDNIVDELNDENSEKLSKAIFMEISNDILNDIYKEREMSRIKFAKERFESKFGKLTTGLEDIINIKEEDKEPVDKIQHHHTISKEEAEALFVDLPTALQGGIIDIKEEYKEAVDKNEISVDKIQNPKESETIKSKKEEDNSKEFTIIGDSNYKVSTISAYVTLENSETYKNKQVSIQVSSIDELNSKINEEIAVLNKENDKQLVDSIAEMMSNNPQFKKELLSLMRDAQLEKPC